MKKPELRQLIKEELQKVLSEGMFNKFTQATVDDTNDKLLRNKLNKVIKIDNREYSYEDRLTDYTATFISDFNQRYKQGKFGPNPLSKEIDTSRDLYQEVRNRFKENGNQITVREIDEIVSPNYLIKK